MISHKVKGIAQDSKQREMSSEKTWYLDAMATRTHPQ